jgi:hypothetical protein
MLAILAGCDTIMTVPVMNPPVDYLEFKLASDALTGIDQYSRNFIAYHRSKRVA